MTWVKVCGLSRPEEVAAAVEAGADAVGFVFYERSPRNVTSDAARNLVARHEALSVAVTVDLDADSLLHLVEKTGVDAVQPHGRNAREAAAAAVEAGLSVLRPVTASAELDLATIPAAELPLIDSDAIGGTGDVFDWGWLEGVDRRYVLAGGLGPDNVGGAIERVRPWGVDASSRLESAPGVKDLSLVSEFVRRAKSA